MRAFLPPGSGALSGMLFPLRGSVALGYRLSFAHVSTFLRRSVALRPREVVDLRLQIGPYDGVRGAMTFRFGLRPILASTSGLGPCSRRWRGDGGCRCGGARRCGRSSRRRRRDRRCRDTAGSALLDVLLFRYALRLIIRLIRPPFGSTFLRCLSLFCRGRRRWGRRLRRSRSWRSGCSRPPALCDIILFLDPLGLVLRLVGPPFILALLDGFLLRERRR